MLAHLKTPCTSIANKKITASSSQKNGRDKHGSEWVHGAAKFSQIFPLPLFSQIFPPPLIFLIFPPPLRNVAVHGSSRPSTPRSRLRTEVQDWCAGQNQQIGSGARHLFFFTGSSHLDAEHLQDVSQQSSIKLWTRQDRTRQQDKRDQRCMKHRGYHKTFY